MQEAIIASCKNDSTLRWAGINKVCAVSSKGSSSFEGEEDFGHDESASKAERDASLAAVVI